MCELPTHPISDFQEQILSTHSSTPTKQPLTPSNGSLDVDMKRVRVQSHVGLGHLDLHGKDFMPKGLWH